jgi:hypothetical protein
LPGEATSPLSKVSLLFLAVPCDVARGADKIAAGALPSRPVALTCNGDLPVGDPHKILLVALTRVQIVLLCAKQLFVTAIDG